MAKDDDKRNRPATIGDLEDLGEAIKAGFHAAFKGKRAPSPDPVDDPADDDDDPADDDQPHKPAFSLSKTWFGEH
jgi:hypothetical protein